VAALHAPHPARRPFFGQDWLAVEVVCAGDSLTGWNHFGPANLWRYPTYPRFLQQLCEPLGLRIADGEIAGEVIDNSLGHGQRYLDLFPNSRSFITIGFDTNDLGTWPDPESTNRRIIENLGRMVSAVREMGKCDEDHHCSYFLERLAEVSRFTTAP